MMYRKQRVEIIAGRVMFCMKGIIDCAFRIKAKIQLFFCRSVFCVIKN